MQIEYKKTNEWTPDDWISYVQVFNHVFNKTFSIDDFKQKYFNTIDGFSYHSFLRKDHQVVGACTIIPYEYFAGESIIRSGLAVDVFILPDHRHDPLSLYMMYQKLKEQLILHNISLVIAVPNDLVYPYWKNIVKWKDIGSLKYYAFPVRLGNVVSGRFKILNGLSGLLIKLFLGISHLYRSGERVPLFRLNRSNRIFEKQRYTSNHRVIDSENHFIAYRPIREDNIDICYLIDFLNKKTMKKDSFSLSIAIRHICAVERPDLILYIGKLKFFQILLFRIPFWLEPKKLLFMADMIKQDTALDPGILLNYKNWDFGLLNFDVR